MKYLVTGGAGFIGSRIAEILISEGNFVRVLDNLSSGDKANLDLIINHSNFEFIKGDIRDFDDCLKACRGIDIIIHQAALVSVPKSIEQPLENNSINISGFLNILEVARINNIKKVVYASSSAVYGDNMDKLKLESRIGKFISPYALSKYADELYAKMYSSIYNLETVGLRYFNVYGPKQDPSSAYSGVISIFMKRLLANEDLCIYGDGEIVRDFIYVDDVARANILAATKSIIPGTVYNIGTSHPTSIKGLANILIKISKKNINISYLQPRKGDILYSCADISKAKKELEFIPLIKIEDGLKKIYDKLSKI